LLQAPAGVCEDHLIAALQAVLDHHDALRLHLDGVETNEWDLEIAPPGAVRAEDCIHRVDLCDLNDEARRACITKEAQAAEGRLAPKGGAMVQAVWFDFGAKESGRLLLTIHHLSIDGVSWRILVPDFVSAWQAIATGREPALPPRGTSFRRWAQCLAANAHDPVRVSELSFWIGMLSEPPPVLIDRPLDPERDTVGRAGNLSFTLPAAVTAPLLTALPAAFHCRINDVLLTALVLAIAEWRRGHCPSDGNAVLIDIEGHGREDVFPETDVSRTVGWFTSLFPLRLDPGTVDFEEILAGGPGLGRALKIIKEQLRTLPDNGLGYGLLRYLNPQTSLQLAGLATPQVGFNYLGRFGTSAAANWAGAPEEVTLGRGADSAMPLAHALEVNALTLDTRDGPQLTATWSWAPTLLTQKAVSDLAQRWFQILGALVRHR
jgi:non-ribosomal peptide synthase protein (TIGR01720 family)